MKELPAIYVQYPKATCYLRYVLLQVGDGLYNISIAHIFGWVVVLIHRQNAGVMRLLLVESFEIAGVERDEDTLDGFGVHPVRQSFCASQRRRHVKWRFDIVTGGFQQLSQPP